MSSVELKSLDRLHKDDRLLVDAGVFVKAGRKIDERAIKLLAEYKITFVPTLSLTYEETEKFTLLPADSSVEDYFIREIHKRELPFKTVRNLLLEKLRSIYVPFHENNPVFQAKGKKKQIIADKLLEGDPPSLYQPDIDAGSEVLLSTGHIRYLTESIKALYKYLESRTYLGPDTRKQKNRIHRVTLHSIRLHSSFSGNRLSIVGDALPWQALDTAIYFLFAMTNMNKKRILKGCPLSVARFDPDKVVSVDGEFQYYPGMICDAAMGVLLHNIGYCHETIHPLLSVRPNLDLKDQASLQKIRSLQKSFYVTRNLLRNRRDLSSITKMICFIQHEYADGTGFPSLNTNKYLHEILRLFQIIKFYDEMTNPVISKTCFSRFEVIEYLKKHSGEYNYRKDEFVPQKRFDAALLEEFLQILAPYDIGEKLYLYPPEKRNRYYFVGRVYSYLDSYIPLISILIDERNNKKYRFGELLFYLPGGTAFYLKGGKIIKQIKLDWIKELQIYDLSKSPGNIAEYEDILFGSQRVLSRRLKRVY